MDDIPRTNLVHHGLGYQDQLLGAITWRYPLIRSLEYDGTRYEGDEIVEATQICLGVDFPNLASAALAQSMERFVRRQGHRRGVRLLVTFVRADFDGEQAYEQQFQADGDDGSQASLAGERALASIERVSDDLQEKVDQFEERKDALRERFQEAMS